MPTFGYNVLPFVDQSKFMFEVTDNKFLEDADIV